MDVIMDAWNMTCSEGVVGSSTVCVATLDKKLGQLSYSNVGDCGLLVVSTFLMRFYAGVLGGVCFLRTIYIFATREIGIKTAPSMCCVISQFVCHLQFKNLKWLVVQCLL